MYLKDSRIKQSWWISSYQAPTENFSSQIWALHQLNHQWVTQCLLVMHTAIKCLIDLKDFSVCHIIRLQWVNTNAQVPWTDSNSTVLNPRYWWQFLLCSFVEPQLSTCYTFWWELPFSLQQISSAKRGPQLPAAFQEGEVGVGVYDRETSKLSDFKDCHNSNLVSRQWNRRHDYLITCNWTFTIRANGIDYVFILDR